MLGATITSPTGYAHPDYAASLSALGRPVALAASGGHVLLRGIPASDREDATGCYPLFSCADWDALADDLDRLKEADPVSVTAVVDPLGHHTREQLARAFPGLVRPFKEHFVVDLETEPSTFVAAHHRRNARRVLRHVTVEVCAEPPAHLDTWYRLYDHLVHRHDVRGAAAFSRAAFAGQLALPGAVLLAARCEGEIVGMQLWFRAGERAYHHLSGYGPLGYRWGGASYGLMWFALQHFRAAGVRWLLLGAAAGVRGDENDGLGRFKAGWSNARRTAWLCGRIDDPAAYRALTAARRTSADYFPAYRAGEHT